MSDFVNWPERLWRKQSVTPAPIEPNICANTVSELVEKRRFADPGLAINKSNTSATGRGVVLKL